MTLDTTILNSTINSFKEFLSTHTSSKEDKVIANIKEDMRHFLRLYKYFEDPTLKELRFEINDSLEELNEVIIIELNAVDIKNIQHKATNLSKNQKTRNISANNAENKSQTKENSLIISEI